METKRNKTKNIEIVIAEDSPTQAEQLRYLLEEHGYAVVAAPDGQQALASIRRHKPALVISDVVMPVLDGYGLCKAIKSDPHLKDIPVILVTTLSDPQDVIRGLECGADNFIRKPYEERYLMSRVEYLLMNLELRQNHKMQMALEINLGGQRHVITAERQQILDLLISTYEQAVHLNEALTVRERELAYSNQVLHGLYHIAEGLNRISSEREVADTALERALELPGIQAGWISLREGETGFRLAAARNLPPVLSGPDALEGDCVCRRKLLSGVLDGVTNILECERLGKAQGDTQGLHYHASVPLWLDDCTLGVMNLVGPGEGLFDDEALKMLYGVGHQVAVALERARLHAHLEKLVEERTAKLSAEITERQRLNRILRVLSGINTTIVRVQDRQALFEEACRIAVEDGGFALAWIGMLDHDSQNIVPMARAGRDDGYLARINLSVAKDAPGTCTLILQALAQTEPVLCNNVATDARMRTWRDAAATRGYRSIAVLPLLLDGGPVGVFALYAPDKTAFDKNEVRLLVEIAGDISFALDHLQKAERLNYLAYFDGVTGLPNRVLFQDRLERAIVEAGRRGRLTGVAYLDLDRFKTINDSLGHGLGDLFLKAVAGRLTQAVRDGDTVARLGGDEFAIVMADMAHAEDAAAVANKVLECFSQPFVVGGRELFSSASLGLTLYPDDGDGAEGLVRNADVAMYRAKVAGGSTYQFYAEDMTFRAHERLTLETDLRRALERREFLLHYQPVIALDGMRITGMEALVRWRHPERGMVSPGDFIPVAEETGLIIGLGEWVLHAACEQLLAFPAATPEPLHMAVNVSLRQFRESDFINMVTAILRRTGLDPAKLDIEITESHLMQNFEATLAAMHRLGDLGVRFSIDDFGTGYSSLARLKGLPIASLKIDQSFVRGIPDDAGNASLVRTIISLGHDLGIEVIAEGVETEAQLEFLRAHGCDKAQGYYLSRPLPAEELTALLSRNKHVFR